MQIIKLKNCCSTFFNCTLCGNVIATVATSCLCWLRRDSPVTMVTNILVAMKSNGGGPDGETVWKVAMVSFY